jgi:phosphatidate cytidylyltransferase
MYFFLRDLTPTQQVGALFVIVFGLLLLASVTTFALSIREYADEARAESRRQELKSATGVLRTSWMMALVVAADRILTV